MINSIHRGAWLESKKVWRASLLGLMFLRLGMWGLFLHDRPSLLDHDGWRFYHGGDEVLFVSLARDILTGDMIRYAPTGEVALTSVGVGLPLMLAGLMRFVGTFDYERLLPLIVIGGGLWMGLSSIGVMAALTRALTGSRRPALLVGLIWTVLPYALWAGFAVHPQAEVLRKAYVPRQMWITGITDGPSLFFVTLGMMFALRGSQLPGRDRSARPASFGGGRRADRGCMNPATFRLGLFVLGGLSLGFGSAIRIHVLPVALVVLSAFAWSRQWGAVFWMSVGLLIGFWPQLWHSTAANFHPLNLPYINGWFRFLPDGRIRTYFQGLPFSRQTILENVQLLVQRAPWAVLAGLGALGFGFYAFVRGWQIRGSHLALIMFGAPIISFVLHAITFVYKTDPIRFTLPAVALGLPALAWTGVTTVNGLVAKVAGRE